MKKELSKIPVVEVSSEMHRRFKKMCIDLNESMTFRIKKLIEQDLEQNER